MNNWLKNTLERGIIRTTLKYNKVHDPKTGRFSSLGAGGSTAARKPRESKATGWGRQTISYSADDIKAPPESGKSRSYAIMPLSTFSKSNAYGGTVTRNEMVMRALGDMSDGTVVGGWTKVSTGNQTFWKKGSNTVLTLPSAVLNQSLHKSIVTRSISNGSLSPQKAISIHKGDYPGIANWPAVQKMLGLTSVSTKALLSDYIKKRMQVRDYKKAAPFLGKNVHPIARNKILGLLKKVSPNTPMGALRLQDNRRDARMKIKLSKLLTLPYQKSSQTSGGKTSVMISLQNPDRNNPDMYVPQNMLGSDGLSHGGWLNRDKFLTASAALRMKAIQGKVLAIRLTSFSEKKSETLKAGKRNYRVEYDNYHGKPEQKSNRNNRNKARRQLGLVKGDGLEAHHKIPMSKGGVNGNGNIQTLTFSENRKRGNKSNGK